MVVCDSSRQFREATNRELLFTHNAPRLSAVGHKLYAGVVAQFLAENSHSLPPPVANGSSATERR